MSRWEPLPTVAATRAEYSRRLGDSADSWSTLEDTFFKASSGKMCKIQNDMGACLPELVSFNSYLPPKALYNV